MINGELKRKRLYLFLLILTVIIIAVFSPVANIAYAQSLTDDDLSADMKTSQWYYDENYFDIAFARAYFENFQSLDKPIFIGVIDTGINYNHEIFKKTLLWVDDGGVQKPVGYNSGDSTKRELISDNSIDYHGTHVAGIIAAMILEMGLEDSVKIIPVRAVNSSNQFTSTAVADAIRWLCGENDLEGRLGYKLECSVINMSLSIMNSTITSSSSWYDLTKLQNAINDYAEKTVFVAAAGNAGKDSANDYSYPASIEEVVSVMNYGNSDDNASLNSNSNYGLYDLAAPGTNIYSATNGTNSYSMKSGTSMSAPFVSVVAAMLKLRYPNETASKLTRMLRNHDSNITMTKDSYLIKGVDVKSVLETDFLANEEYQYITPSKIIVKLISAESTLKQNMRDRKEVKFLATIAPADSHNPKYDNEIIWAIERMNGDGSTYVERIKGGREFVFDSRFNGMLNKVWAELEVGNVTLSSESTEISIEYAQFDFSEIKITPIEWISKEEEKEIPCYVGTPLTLSFSNIEYCDKTVEIKWFIDGELVYKGNNGSVFVYTPKTMGRHLITAKIDGYAVEELYVDVKMPVAVGFTIFGIEIAVSIVFVLIIALALKAKPFVVKVKASKNPTTDSDNIKSDTDNYDTDVAEEADAAKNSESGKSSEVEIETEKTESQSLAESEERAETETEDK